MTEKLPKATHQGKLKIGAFNINCAVVLVNNKPVRVLSERSIAKGFGIKGGGAYWEKKKSDKGAALLPEYISAKYLAPFVDKDLKDKFSKTITYTAINKTVARGLEAVVLPDICNVWIRAEKEGALSTQQQKEIAERAYILMRGFATVGIISLVDEATGYQEIRDKNALREMLDKYLLKEQAKWAKRFPDEFYEQIFRLRGWQWKGMKVNRPSIVGRYTNDLVYERLAPGILAELRKLNPPDDRGVRKSTHQQYFTEDIGHPALQRHLNMLVGIERASANWGSFYRMVQRALPKLNQTIPLALEEDEE
jgi:hypothetical protein